MPVRYVIRSEGRTLSPLVSRERRALSFVRSMLSLDKLGGVDGVFDTADLDAVTAALLEDTPGLVRAVRERLLAGGRFFEAGIAERALQDLGDRSLDNVRARIFREARAEIRKTLAEELRRAGVESPRVVRPDSTSRSVTFDELREFESAIGVWNGRLRRIGEGLGGTIVFPGGPSREAIDFVLDQRAGLPPGAILRPRRR